MEEFSSYLQWALSLNRRQQRSVNKVHSHLFNVKLNVARNVVENVVKVYSHLYSFIIIKRIVTKNIIDGVIPPTPQVY